MEILGLEINWDMSTLSIIVSIIFGVLSVSLVVYVSNISRREIYIKVNESMSHLRSCLVTLSTCKMQLSQKAVDEYNADINGHKHAILMQLLRINGRIKSMPRYFEEFENLTQQLLLSECNKIAHFEEYSYKITRQFDFFLNSNKIYGFPLLRSGDGKIYTIKYKRNMFLLINGFDVVIDKKNKGYKTYIRKSIKLEKKIKKVKQASIDKPTNVKLRKKLIRLYKRKYIVISSYKTPWLVWNRVRLISYKIQKSIKKRKK